MSGPNGKNLPGVGCPNFCQAGKLHEAMSDLHKLVANLREKNYALRGQYSELLREHDHLKSGYFTLDCKDFRDLKYETNDRSTDLAEGCGHDGNSSHPQQVETADLQTVIPTGSQPHLSSETSHKAPNKDILNLKIIVKKNEMKIRSLNEQIKAIAHEEEEKRAVEKKLSILKKSENKNNEKED